MKTYVVTGADYSVIGTARISEEGPEGTPVGGRISPSSQQTVHEVDLPDEILSLADSDVGGFHAVVQQYLRQRPR